MQTCTSNMAVLAMKTDDIRRILYENLPKKDLAGKRVLVIIPDDTRSGPIGLFFRLFHGMLKDKVDTLDYLVALGTHQPMSKTAICEHLGVNAEEMVNEYSDVQVFNHRWNDPATFRHLGTIPAIEIEELSGGRLSLDVPIRINKLIFNYDQVLVCGPVFPHEVVGFSGGNKYFFPGVSGQTFIDVTHWLGALITSFEIIGTKHTPVRAAIDRAAAMIRVPKLACCFVVHDGDVVGLYVGTPEDAWSEAVELSAQLHVKYAEKPFQQVLSVMPEMYDDIWTAAKGMYKLEPVIADGGEVIIYAPHITEISYTHGDIIEEIGYHVRDYFVKQWKQFKGYPWGVLAHSTHLRGAGTYEDGVERPRIQVTLATGISRKRCDRVNLGYCDPKTIIPQRWAGREDEGILLVPRAGETLYQLSNDKLK